MVAKVRNRTLNPKPSLNPKTLSTKPHIGNLALAYIPIAYFYANSGSCAVVDSSLAIIKAPLKAGNGCTSAAKEGASVANSGCTSAAKN